MCARVRVCASMLWQPSVSIYVTSVDISLSLPSFILLFLFVAPSKSRGHRPNGDYRKCNRSDDFFCFFFVFIIINNLTDSWFAAFEHDWFDENKVKLLWLYTVSHSYMHAYTHTQVLKSTNTHISHEFQPSTINANDRNIIARSRNKKKREIRNNKHTQATQ